MSNIQEEAGDKIIVRYIAKRCIHAAECVKGLPKVFDIHRKPWIDPNAASADAIMEVISRCPSGALQFERTDGGPSEVMPPINTVTLMVNGPLSFRGRLEILSTNGEVTTTDTRMTLCRCGLSKNNPYCDNSHSKGGFKDNSLVLNNFTKTFDSIATDQAIKITPITHGPLGLRGPLEIIGSSGPSRYRCDRVFLCRCGASKNKPFCDSSHRQTLATRTNLDNRPAAELDAPARLREAAKQFARSRQSTAPASAPSASESSQQTPQTQSESPYTPRVLHLLPNDSEIALQVVEKDTQRLVIFDRAYNRYYLRNPEYTDIRGLLARPADEVVVTTIPRKSLAKEIARLLPHELDLLLWKATLAVSQGQLFEGLPRTGFFQLRRWPDLKRLGASLAHQTGRPAQERRYHRIFGRISQCADSRCYRLC